ncbi:cytochrome P450 [Rhypophila decipiens]|uniref:Cytochrome P450 n=1 Tax=Rhypophila decipiens TaxID=261697 RepID=A0AAN6Y9Z5_9PEZI|nr:cytochrome P450 [Rhypophila decipiens]
MAAEHSFTFVFACGALLAYAVYHVIRAIYLIYFSPLAAFPGSPWAALGEYWEAWHNIGSKAGKRGQTLFLLEKMHRDPKYGSAIRLGPNEVHIYDPRYFHTLYSLNTQFYKDPSMHKVFGAPSSTLAEADPVKHKARRQPLESLFSRQSVLKLEPMLLTKIDLACSRFRDMYSAGKPVKVEWALKSLSFDMVSEFCFGQSLGALYHDDFMSDGVQVFRTYLNSLHVIKAFPFVRVLSQSLPLWLARRVSKTIARGKELEIFIKSRVESFVRAYEGGSRPLFPTLMERLLSANAKQQKLSQGGDPTSLQQWKSHDNLRDEAITMISAGTDTTGISALVGLFNIIHHPHVQDRLLKELRTVLPGKNDTAPFTVIEKLPYLTAVIKETLRYASPAASRTPRLVPKGGTTLPDGRFIPEGTRVGMAIYHVHYNENIFPEPRKFMPERWLDASQGGIMPERLPEMNRFLVAFSKGTRACLGINLAYMELYLTLAYLIRRFDFQTNTTKEDMRWDDMVVPSFYGEFTVMAKPRAD